MQGHTRVLDILARSKYEHIVRVGGRIRYLNRYRNNFPQDVQEPSPSNTVAFLQTRSHSIVR